MTEIDFTSDRHIVFNSIVTGTLFVFFFYVSFSVMNCEGALKLLRFFINSVACSPADSTTAIVKLSAIAVGLSTIGLVIRVLSIISNQGRHGVDLMREALAQEIWETAKDDARIPEDIRDHLRSAIQNRKFDPFFVWLQYSDPEPELREWGRTRRRYMYLGENWSLALKSSFWSGTVIGFVSHPFLPSDSWWLAALWFPWFFSYIILQILLEKLIDHNSRAEQAMVSVYLAGIFSDKLRTEFLEPLTDWKG